jgi:hypothetical protein
METPMNKLSILVLSAFGLFAFAGCMAPVDGVDGVEDVDGEDDSEDVAETEQAVVRSVPCTLIVPSFGQLQVRITNNTGVYIDEGEVDYTIYHYYTQTTYHKSNLLVSELAPGAYAFFNASADPNALSASHCTATLSY